MKKNIFTSLFLLSLSVSSLPLGAMGLDDPLDSQEDRIKTTNIGHTRQYKGLPQVPLVHHYTNFHPPKVLLALKGSLPETTLGKNPRLLKAMNAVGVAPTDPFLIVVQGFSKVVDPNMSFEANPKAPLILRPMYYFSENTSLSSEASYNESITLRAATVGNNNDLKITPDTNVPPHQFTISVHNSIGTGTAPQSPQDFEMLSSGANMALPDLAYNVSNSFFGFYKGIARTVNGTVRTEDRGVSVLHVLLNDADEDLLRECLWGQKTVGAVFNRLRTLEGNPCLDLAIDVLQDMLPANAVDYRAPVALAGSWAPAAEHWGGQQQLSEEEILLESITLEEERQDRARATQSRDDDAYDADMAQAMSESLVLAPQPWGAQQQRQARVTAQISSRSQLPPELEKAFQDPASARATFERRAHEYTERALQKQAYTPQQMKAPQQSDTPRDSVEEEQARLLQHYNDQQKMRSSSQKLPAAVQPLQLGTPAQSSLVAPLSVASHAPRPAIVWEFDPQRVWKFDPSTGERLEFDPQTGEKVRWMPYDGLTGQPQPWRYDPLTGRRLS
jgi:hypothetical protein